MLGGEEGGRRRCDDGEAYHGGTCRGSGSTSLNDADSAGDGELIANVDCIFG